MILYTIHSFKCVPFSLQKVNNRQIDNREHSFEIILRNIWWAVFHLYSKVNNRQSIRTLFSLHTCSRIFSSEVNNRKINSREHDYVIILRKIWCAVFSHTYNIFSSDVNNRQKYLTIMNTFKTSTISKEGNKNILRNSIITRYLKGVGEYHCTYLHYLTLQKKKGYKKETSLMA